MEDSRGEGCTSWAVSDTWYCEDRTDHDYNGTKGGDELCTFSNQKSKDAGPQRIRDGDGSWKTRGEGSVCLRLQVEGRKSDNYQVVDLYPQCVRMLS